MDEFRDEYLSNALKNWVSNSRPKPALRSHLLSIAAIMPRRIVGGLEWMAPPAYARQYNMNDIFRSNWFTLNAYHAGLNSVRLLA